MGNWEEHRHIALNIIVHFSWMLWSSYMKMNMLMQTSMLETSIQTKTHRFNI